MKHLLLALLVISTSVITKAQTSKTFWFGTNEKAISNKGERVIVPNKYKVFSLTGDNLRTALFSAPSEKTVGLNYSQLIIELPMPNGSVQQFKVVESPVMEKALADQFPNIKTFNVRGIDEPSTYGKLDWTEFGFHGMLFSPLGNIFIDPYSRNNTTDYITYYTADFTKKLEQRSVPECGAINTNTNRVSGTGSSSTMTANIWAGATLRTYRFAVGCTGEYAVAATGVASPTTAQILSAVTTSVNRVDGVYETEAAIKLVLVATETAVLFANASTDPYTGNNNSNTLINESQTVIDANIGTANYDIGHTFSTGGGGLAQLGCVCGTSKARGITGSAAPVGDAYDIDFVAHEVGHEFGGNHSYNQCTGNATQNAGTMVEPLSGISIMGYAGVCATADNLSAHSIPYFHTISYDEVMTFSNNGGGNSCAVKTTTGNNPPVVTGSATYTIPKSTPFTLTGSATDANGDALSFSWEEIDNNSTAHAGGTAAPYFRSYNPTTSPSRTFPQSSVILTGATSQLGEYLPSTAQTLNFRLVARDNKVGGGGVAYASTQVVIASSGPLAITAPNTTGITWASGSSQTVTWNVNSTNTAPVSCANVNILLSTDGGVTWSTLLANTPNDGTQAITVTPQATTKTNCRIKVEAVGNIFFDINDKAFTITATTSPIASVAIAITTGSNPMCPASSVTFTATPTNGGTAPTYQWMVNGANAGTGGATFTTSTLTNGQVVSCAMTSNLASVIGSPATSNSITMTVGTTSPAVTITGDSVICSGGSTTFTATPTNGGTTPSYQWAVNGSAAGSNSATFTSTALTNGQVVSCAMTTTASCVTTTTATSNSVTMIVNTAATTPFTQNFEGATFPPAGWVVENSDGPSVVWGTAGAKGIERRPAAGNTGSASGSAGLDCFDYSTDTTLVDNLISAPVSLSGASTAKMTFKRAYKYYADATSPNNYLDELRVYVSTDCGSTYSSALYYKKGKKLATNGTINTIYTPAAAADWDIDTVDLTAYVNQNVMVKFEYSNKYGNNIYIDDVNITSTTGGATVASVAIAETVGANPICAGASATFTATPTNGGTAPTYQWKVNGTNVGTGVSYTTTALANNDIVTCVVTSNLAGVTGSPATSSSITMTVNALPNVTASANPTTVCAGSSSTLTGAGATSFTWSSGQATATASVTPTAATTYTVTGTTSGCSSTATTTVGYTALPNVTASANPTTVCAGSSSTLTGAGATSFTWSSGQATATASVTPTASTTYTVTGTTGACSKTATVTVGYTALPNVTASANPSTVCAGSSSTLTGTGATSFTWSSGQSTATASVTPTAASTYTVIGTTSGCSKTSTVTVGYTALPSVTASANPTSVCAGSSSTLTGSGATTFSWSSGQATATASVTPTSPTTYTVTGTTNGCSSTATTTVSVTAAPNVTASANPTSVCAGSSSTLTGGGATSYTWSSGDAIATATVTPTATTTYTLTGTTGGCSKTVTTTVNYTAIPAVTASASPTSVCAGSSSTLTGTGATSFTWSSGQATATASVTPTAATTYTVTGTTNGCTNTSTVTVSYTALPNVTASANPTTVCSGSSSTLTGTGATSFTWSSGQSTASASVTPTGSSTTYTVTGTTNGCSNTATTTVNVTAAPTITASANPSVLCSGDATALSSSGATSYSWSTGDATQSASASPTTATTYTVTGTTNGCSVTANVSVAVNSSPSTPTISQSQDNLTASGNAGDTYEWYLNGGSTIVATGQTFTATQSGDYTVVVSNASTCSATSMVYTFTLTGMFKTNANAKLNVYPNPSNGIVTVDGIITGKVAKIQVYNEAGMLVYQAIDENANTNLHTELKLDNLSNGNYEVRVITQNSTINKHIVILK